MTQRDVPPAAPPGAPSSSGEVEYVRRLSLAILSTLQTKGLLSADEVDAILIAARRAAQLPGAASQGQTRSAATPQPVPAGARPAAAMQVTVQPPGSLTWHTTPPGAASGAEKQAAPGEGKAEEKASAEAVPLAAQADAAASSSSPLAGPSAVTGEGLGEPEAPQSTPDGNREDGPERAAAQDGADSPEQRPQPPMFDIKLD